MRRKIISMNPIYIDRLTLSSLMAVILSRIKYSHILYFNKSSIADNIVNLFIKIRLLKVKPKPVEFNFGEIRDEKGGCQSLRVGDDLRNICFEISRNEFKNNNFLKKFNSRFDFRKIEFFFEKIVAEEINGKVVFVHAAKWHAANKISSIEKSIIFFLEKDLWSKYLCHYISKLGVKPIEYRPIINSFYLICLKLGKDFLSAKIKALLNRSNIISRTNRDKEINIKEKNTNVAKNMKVPLIAVWYTGKAITFDLKKRSDFFWLLKSDVPRGQVLIYFDREDIPVTEDTANILKSEGIKKSLALTRSAVASKNIPIWNPTAEYKKLRNSLIGLILQTYLLNAVRFNIPSLFFIINMLNFTEKYAYWHDFFDSNNIKVHISPRDFTKPYAAKNLALEHCGGVSVSYQWSNLDFSSIVLSSCSDTMFSFGPEYKWIWRDNRSAIDNLVYCGYITDYAFKEVREDSFKLRKQLIDKGVKFVICFFDENSHNDRLSVITNAKSAETYAYFIRKMLEDETLGLIFKPGYPRTLFQRISSIGDLIEKAKATGRCVFVDKGSYVTEQYPTEAAQAADLCIGLLLSGTVAMESYLSGTPTVFLDLEKLYSNPIYQWGKGKVVFDNLDDLFMAINKYKENPESISGFGDLSLWVKDKDPFKDGNASLRMGQYINWLLDMFNQGKTREEAMEYANLKYADHWGEENVVKWR